MLELEQRVLGWPRRKRKGLFREQRVTTEVVGDVSLDDPPCEPPSPHHHRDMGCVSLPSSLRLWKCVSIYYSLYPSHTLSLSPCLCLC